MNKRNAVFVSALLALSATMSGLYMSGTDDTTTYPELPATVMAADPPHNITHFLHTGDTARYFSPQLSVLNYFDTDLPTDEGHNYTGQEQFAMQWYMYPQIASELTLSGADAVIWISGEVGTGQPNMAGSVEVFEVTEQNILDLNFSGTQVSLYNVPSSTPIYTYPPAAPMIFPMEFNYTFSANSTLRFVLTINPGTSGGGVASQYTNVTVYWDSYHLFDSRLILNTENPLTIDDAAALDYEKKAVDGFVGETNTTMYFQANISDPFGGYDIQWVNLTVYDPEGGVVAGLEDVPMERISGTDVSSPCVYELAWDYADMTVGEYTFVVWAVDNSGWTYFYYFAQYEFTPYDETFVATFVIGVMYELSVHLTDTMGLDIVGALATFENQEAYSNETGWADLTVFGNGTLVVFWHGVSVNETWVDVTNTSTLEVACAVYYPELIVLDSMGEPLPSAAVFFSYPDGEQIPAMVSDVNGSVGAIDQVPVGESPVSIWWRGALVFNGTVTVDHNGETDVTCEVYYMSVLVTDYGGTVIPMASVAWLDSTSHILIDSRFVNETGWATARLPVGGYDIEVYWFGALVNQTSATLTGNMELEVQCAVSYLTVYTVDSDGTSLDGVEVAIFDSNGDAIAYGVTVDGKVEFWLPDQTVTVQGHLVDEYMMTTVSQYVETDVDVTYGAEATLTFGDYPPSVVSTTLFSYAVLLALVAALGVALLYLQVLKPRKGRKTGGDASPPAEEQKAA
jgi:hypothetical protein